MSKYSKHMSLSKKILIIIAILLILISASYLIWYYLGDTIQNEITKLIQKEDNNTPEQAEVQAEEGLPPISSEEALQMAYDKFVELGEKDLNKEELELLKTRRDGIEYYYISSRENVIEIIIKGGIINRVNNEKAQE